MATETSVQIKGLKELDDLLKALPAEIEGKIVRTALRNGQKVIADAARSILSANGNMKSGALYRSVRIAFNKKEVERFGWMRARVFAGNRTAWYAHLIEFGTGQYYAGTKSNSKRAPYVIKPKTRKALFFGGQAHEQVTHPGIRPQPFMRPALDANGHKAIETFADYVRDRLPKEIKRLRK